MSGFGREYDNPDSTPPYDEDPTRRSWTPVDLDAVLNGDRVRPTPIVGARADGVGMFYPGKCHTISGESEGGKSWLALHACLIEMDRGNTALYIDFEDDEYSVTDRLLLMGAKPDQIRERFIYLTPEHAIGTDGTNRSDLRDVMLGHKPTIAFLDGVTEALALHGYDANKNNEVATFGQLLPSWIAKHGAAVGSLDHVSKNSENRGRYAIGAVHKLNGLNGAAYTVDNRHPFGIGRKGVSYVMIQKDRPAQLRRHAVESAGGFWFADLVVDATGDDGLEVDVEVYAPNPTEGPIRPTKVMGLIMVAVTKHGPLSKRRIRAAVAGKNETKDTALELLILDGFLSETTPHSKLKDWTDQ